MKKIMEDRCLAVGRMARLSWWLTYAYKYYIESLAYVYGVFMCLKDYVCKMLDYNQLICFWHVTTVKVMFGVYWEHRNKKSFYAIYASHIC
jgi:hypothetical protein